jgi:hypothetical protein
MSLSKQVRETGSPVRLFFREHLPRTHPILGDCNVNRLKGLETMPLSAESHHPTTMFRAHLEQVYRKNSRGHPAKPPPASPPQKSPPSSVPSPTCRVRI